TSPRPSPASGTAASASPDRGRTFRTTGPQRYRPAVFRVPGDASGAAYLWAGAALTGGRVTVRGIDRRWPQADLAVLPLLRQYGASVRARGTSVTVAGDARRPFSVNLTDAPDLYPLAGVLAASAPGRSRLRGGAQVVHKESDRRAGTVRLARALGARVRSAPGGALEIDGRARLRRLDLRGLSDHRMLMSAAVAALGADGPSRLGPRAAVGKSFPGFWRSLARLGAPEIGT
ncbi:3-phosphoshikimate 1-carboxyvinyltransferase, core domain protein, partial [mine drainage metagenome]